MALSERRDGVRLAARPAGSPRLHIGLECSNPGAQLGDFLPRPQQPGLAALGRLLGQLGAPLGHPHAVNCSIVIA